MGAGASSRSSSKARQREQQQWRRREFDELAVCTVADLQYLESGTRVQVVGHIEAADSLLHTPFQGTQCVAAEIVGAMASWRPQSLFDLRKDGASVHDPLYTPFLTCLRAAQSVSFLLRDPPASYAVESPGRIVQHIVTRESATVRIVLPETGACSSGQSHASRLTSCSVWLGHKHSCDDWRFDPAHGVLQKSQWKMDYPVATLLSPGRVAPHAHAFWNRHILESATLMRGVRVERWSQVVNQGNAPCWMRRYKVTERTLREGDTAAVIGELRHTATGVELHGAHLGWIPITC